MWKQPVLPQDAEASLKILQIPRKVAEPLEPAPECDIQERERAVSPGPSDAFASQS